MLSAPEYIVIDHEGGNAEHAVRLSFRLYAANRSWPFLHGIDAPTFYIGTRFRQNGPNSGDILDIQLALEEPLEDKIVVGAKNVLYF